MRPSCAALVLRCGFLAAFVLVPPPISGAPVPSQADGGVRLPREHRMTSPSEDAGADTLRGGRVLPSSMTAPVEAVPEMVGRLAAGSAWAKPARAFAPAWGGDVPVGTDDVVRNAEFDYDILDGTLYAYLWRDWSGRPEHRLYASTDGGQSWSWRTGSTYDPLQFNDADFVYCDSIAVAVCAFTNAYGNTISSDRFNMKNLAWDPGHAVFYSSATSDSVYSLAVATDCDDYPHLAYVYLVAHVGHAIRFWRSLDKGKTWVDPIILDQGNVQFPDVTYAWQSSGKVYVTYFKDGDVHLARNTAFGATAAWIPDWRTMPIQQADGMSVVAAVRDTVLVLYERYYATWGSDQMEILSSNDDGTTWGGQLITMDSATHLYPDITGRNGVFRIAYFEFDGLDRHVMYKRCRSAALRQWEPSVSINDHYPYWDVKPFGNPCVEGMPGGDTGVMYTGFDENRLAWFDREGATVEVPSGEAPPLSASLSAFPNPSAGRVLLSFETVTADEVVLDVYDVAGRRVAHFDKGRLAEGAHSVEWDREGCGDGIYFVTLRTSRTVERVKVVLLH